jgi:hypothetical protein
VPCKVTKKDGMKAVEEQTGQAENKRPATRKAPRRLSETAIRGGQRGGGAERGPGFAGMRADAAANGRPGGPRGSASGQRGASVGAVLSPSNAEQIDLMSTVPFAAPR